MAEGRADHFLRDQFLAGSNFLTFPLWLTGLWLIFFTDRGRPYRILGWMYLVPLVVFLLAKGRFYYLAPAYPMLLASGATWWVAKIESYRRRTQRIAIALTLLLLLAGAVETGRALMPVATLHSPLWNRQIRVVGDFPDEIGWEELVAEVASVYHQQTVSPGRVAILTGNYGEAGAVDFYRHRFNLPEAISGINSFWGRGYGAPPPDKVVLIGFSRKVAERYFGDVVLARHITNKEGVKNEETEEHPDLFVVRHPRKPWPELWLELRSFG